MDSSPASESVIVIVNGSPRPTPANASLDELVSALGLAGRPIAVELDGEVLPRSALAGRRLAGGERIEIVTFVGGG